MERISGFERYALLVALLLVVFTGCWSRGTAQSSGSGSSAESGPESAVRVEAPTIEDRSGDKTTVKYRVQNRGSEPVWLVVEEPLGWSRRGKTIELSTARKQMQPGVEPFGYFPPETQKLPPGEGLDRQLTLSWPLELSGLWNDRRRADPSPGTYRLRIEVGYGLQPEPNGDVPTTGDIPESARPVERPTLGWQRTVESDAAPLTISDH